MKGDHVRKALSVMQAVMMISISLAVCVSIDAQALDFVEPLATVPWTSDFVPTDSVWDSSGNHCVVVGNDTSGLQSSAWYYNDPVSTWFPILEGTDPTVPPANNVTNQNSGFSSSSIQTVINAASPGDVIEIWSGTYTGQILINKQLTLVGNGSANTIINGGGAGTVVTITADGTKLNNVTVKGSGAAIGSAGILLFNADNCVIENNTIEMNQDGICLQGSTNNLIWNNDVRDNAGTGIITEASPSTKTLVGLTSEGGFADYGTMFKMDPSGANYSRLHDFSYNYQDGGYPANVRLIQDLYDSNSLIGTTQNGGLYDRGTVFKVSKDGAVYTLLHEFNSMDGESPRGGVVQYLSSVYGATQYGGMFGNGVIFKINTDGTGFTILHDFDSPTGAIPYGALAIRGTSLYGTTYSGGSSGMGTIFRIGVDGTGFTVLHNFIGGAADGAYPRDGVIVDSSTGTTMYGLTYRGGTSNVGTIFRMNTDGSSFAVMTSFAGANGQYPYGSLLQNGGTLYGMAYNGGSSGYGVVFQISTGGTGFTVLYNFTVASGYYPYGSLAQDATYLYGMCYQGGTNGVGTVFALHKTTKVLSTRYNFLYTPDGGYPLGSFFMSGVTMYATTGSGGQYGGGTVFKINTDGSAYLIIHSFDTRPTDGLWPYGGVAQSGNYMFGMAQEGYSSTCGGIFRTNIDGTGYTVIKEFLDGPGDGAYPYGSLMASSGVLYGTTNSGGISGPGVLFKINEDGSGFSTMHEFTGAPDGSSPYDTVVQVGATLYGMTYGGGTSNYGTIYKINTDGSGYSVIFNFLAATTGSYPRGRLITDGTFLYGMTRQGGASNLGLVFKVNLAGGGFTILHTFTGGIDGASPYGKLTLSGSTLYGITCSGGTNNYGTIFRVNTDASGYSILRSLSSLDGAYCYGGLTIDGPYLYGITNSQGSFGYGTAFRMNKDTMAFTVLHNFQGNPDGSGAYLNDITVIMTPPYESESNFIYHNIIVSNIIQARDDSGSNIWSYGYPAGGNYWSNYGGVDLNSGIGQAAPPPDGIGDSSFGIPGTAGSYDVYPWMNPDGWSMPYTTFNSVAWDQVHQRFWICGDVSTGSMGRFYYIPVSAPTAMVPIMAPPLDFTALATDENGNVLLGGNDISAIFYYDVNEDNGYSIVENGTGAMNGWNITGMTFNPYDDRFYLVGNVMNMDVGVAFVTDTLPLNQSGRKCYIDTSDFMNFPGIGGLKSIAWNPVRNYSIAVGDGVYRLNPYNGNPARELSWTTIAPSQAGRSFYDVSWDFNGSNEAGIVGNDGLFGVYWRYYDTNPFLLDGYTDSVSGTVYTTCAMKPPSSPKWLLIPTSDGGYRINIQEQDDSGTVSFNSDFPHAFTVSIWKQSDVLRPDLIDSQIDADSTYTFLVEGNYTVAGIDRWNTLTIRICAWYDNFNVGLASAPGSWASSNFRSRQFNLTYNVGIGTVTMLYPNLVGGIQEFSIAGVWSDPAGYGADGKTHRLMINVTFGPQTWAADGGGFVNPNGGAWDKNLALNDAGSWDMQIHMFDTTTPTMYNMTYQEFGVKEFASISSSGNPSGSAPPGTNGYYLNNPCVIHYSANTQYVITVKIPDLHQNGDILNPNIIAASNLQVQNIHSLATSASSDISAQTYFPAGDVPIFVWGTELPFTPLQVPFHGTECAGPAYTDYSGAVTPPFEVTEIEWWIDVPAGVAQGTYRSTITLTITN